MRHGAGRFDLVEMGTFESLPPVLSNPLTLYSVLDGVWSSVHLISSSALKGRRRIRSGHEAWIPTAARSEDSPCWVHLYTSIVYI